MKIYLCMVILSCLSITGNIFAQTRQRTVREELLKMERELELMKNESQQSGVNNSNQQQQYERIPESSNPNESITPNMQSLVSKKWTLEECIQHAINNNLNIQQLKVQRGVASIQHNTAKNSRLPDLTVGASQDWTFGRSQVYTNLDETMSRSVFGITSSIPIFTGFRIPNEIAKAELDVEAATQNLEKAKDNLSINVTSLFLQVLFNEELVKINTEQLDLTKTQVKRTEIMIEGGMVPPSNLYDIQAQLAKDRVSVIEAKNNLELTLLDLAQSLELEDETQFNITTPSFNENLMTDMYLKIQPARLIFENAVSFKAVIKEQEYKVASARKALKIAQADYMPNLNFVFELGSGYLYRYDAQDQINPNTNEIIKANSSFATQLKNNDYTLVGLKLTIPIFNRFQTRNKVRTAKLDIQNQKLILENTKKTLYKEIQTANKNAIASYEKYTASNDAVKSTAESLKHAQIRYDIAKLTPFEYNEAKTKFIQSQLEQIQAKYDYILRTKILDFYNGIPIRL